MCNCIQEVSKKLSEKVGTVGEITNVELFSQTIYSTFEYKQGKKKKSILVMHTFCPICGKKYGE